jgi:hypothetical protein
MNVDAMRGPESREVPARDAADRTATETLR